MTIPSFVKVEYAERRAAALAERDGRVQKAYALIPRLSEIAAEKQALILALGKAQLLGEAEAGTLRKQTESRLAELSAEQAALLEKKGLPQDELLPKWNCPLCQDTGYVGETQRQPCRCVQQRLLELSHASSRLDPAQCFEHFDQQIFKNERQRKLTQRAAQLCMEYAASYPNNDVKGLMLIGQSGLGKTFLLNCIGNMAMGNNSTVLMVTAYRLLDSYLAAIKGGTPVDFMTPQLLLIDDLGSEPIINNISREYLFTIINERQSAGLGIAIATNLSPENLYERYGERLFSRLVAPKLFSVLLLEGEDLRK